jgi:hypothetical protein
MATQEDDRLSTGLLGGVTALAVGLMTLGVVWTAFTRWQFDLELPGGPPRPAARLERRQVGMVIQVPLGGRFPAVTRDEQEAWLQGQGWVDRSRGVAHVPIAVARQLLLESHRAGTPVLPVPLPPALPGALSTPGSGP